MGSEVIIKVTDIEDFDDVDVIEVLVAPGDRVEVNQSIVTLESDKAMMEFPANEAGTVKSVEVSVGDKVNQGDVLVILDVEPSNKSTNAEAPAEQPKQGKPAKKNKTNNKQKVASSSKKSHAPKKTNPDIAYDNAYASPAVRRYAGELGVNLEEVSGSGNQGRVLKSDVQSHVQAKVSVQSTQVSEKEYVLPDFSKYGEVEKIRFNKLRQVSAKHLHHAWSVAPHVSQFDEADITELERVRKELKISAQEQEIKLTLLPFIMKALVQCLQEFPYFNSSLNHDVTGIIHKKFYNIGIAVDTPRGLVVPVVKDVDNKKLLQLAKELMDLTQLARENKLTPKHMQGGCMTITSLGGIGGQHFTPIINYPEVAILGVSRSQSKLVKNNDVIDERLMLPLSLSYDHRAIDGVAAVKFITSLKHKLSDVWSLMV